MSRDLHHHANAFIHEYLAFYDIDAFLCSSSEEGKEKKQHFFTPLPSFVKYPNAHHQFTDFITGIEICRAASCQPRSSMMGLSSWRNNKCLMCHFFEWSVEMRAASHETRIFTEVISGMHKMKRSMLAKNCMNLIF